MMTKLKNNQAGVTLLELIVSVTIFTIMILAATAIFQLVIEAQRNAIAAQNVQESMRYSLEVMSKEIRSAKRDVGGACAGAGKVYWTDSSQLKFINKYGECARYYLSGNSLTIDRAAKTASTTPNEIKVTSLKFNAVDDEGTQSRVTLMMDVEALGKGTQKQPLKIQTTLSSRNYEW